jgi:hypothetical protein
MKISVLASAGFLIDVKIWIAPEELPHPSPFLAISLVE